MEKIVILFLFTFSSITALAQNSSDCGAGKYFDASLNRCVMQTKTVENKTEALNCQGLSGEAAQTCFKNIVDGEMSEMEASGKVESAKNPKANYIIPAIVTLGSAYYLFTRSDKLKSCGSISVYLMLGGGVTTILGEFMAQRKYKSKLKKMEENYKEKTDEEKSAKSSDDLETINANQTIAFDYQIEQERARESAHKTRKTVYTAATVLYAGATAAAIYEAITLGPMGAKCSAGAGSAGYFTPINGKLDVSIASLSNPDQFSEYTHLEKITSAEFREIVFRNIANIILPSAQADATAGASADAVEGAAIEASKKAGGVMDGVLGKPVVRAAVSGLLAIYSKKIASKAGKLAKEAAERAEAIEELKENFLANGGAGFQNCTETERAQPSKPTCYCYQADGSRNPSRAESPTCQAVYGRTGAKIGKAENYNLDDGMPFEAKGCLTKSGSFDESCNCKKTNSCSSISGSLKLGQLGNIGGLSKTVDDAAKFTNGQMSAGELSNSGLERAVSSVTAAVDKMKGNPKAKDIAKTIDDMGFKIEKSFGNAIRNAARNRGISPALAALSTGGLGAGDIPTDIKPTLAALKPGSSVSGSPSPINLNSGGKAGVTMDDFDFSSGNKGGVTIDDSKADIMAKEFKVDDINNNSSVSIFSIISNRYQTTGLRSLFSDEGEVETDAD